MRKTLILIAVLSWSLLAITAASATDDPYYDGDLDIPESVLAEMQATGSILLGTAPAPDFIFPIVGVQGVDYNYTDTYGAPRSGGRTHEGVDIGSYGVKGVPVVASASGTVDYVNWSTDPSDLNPERCCSLTIDHADGWSTWYLHLNNDTPGTDDGLAWGIADGIVPGATVYAGQLIGWVGDSGNAEAVSAHLHWEVHQPGGAGAAPVGLLDVGNRGEPKQGTERFELRFAMGVQIRTDLGVEHGSSFSCHGCVGVAEKKRRAKDFRPSSAGVDRIVSPARGWRVAA
jgi:murein DD-endopeptidase MepM/ murein hydrolase activator NlpD